MLSEVSLDRGRMLLGDSVWEAGRAIVHSGISPSVVLHAGPSFIVFDTAGDVVNAEIWWPTFSRPDNKVAFYNSGMRQPRFVDPAGTRVGAWWWWTFPGYMECDLLAQEGIHDSRYQRGQFVENLSRPMPPRPN
ncbi:MAG TPA: hypothetical protein VII06_01485 [Chloroflexota bacterium]